MRHKSSSWSLDLTEISRVMATNAGKPPGNRLAAVEVVRTKRTGVAR